MRTGLRFSRLIVAALLALAAAATGRDEFAARLKAGADLIARSAYAEALRALEPLVADPLADDPAFAGDLQYYIGQAYYRLDKYPEADPHWQLAIARTRAAGDRAGEARALRAVAQMRKNQGRYAEGLEAGTAAITLYDAIGDRRNAALGWIVIGAIHDLIGEHQQALDSYLHAVPGLADDQTASRANLLYEMGITYKNLGKYADALRCYTEALDIYKRLDDARNQAIVLGNVAVLYGTIGDNERGLSFNGEALRLSRTARDRRGEAIALLNMSDFYWALGRHDKAIDALTQELAIAQEIGARTEVALAHKNLGDIHAVDGQLALAHDEYDRALQLQMDMGERRTQGSTLIALADLAEREGHTAAALDLARRALGLADDTQRPELEWDARRTLAAAEAAAGRTADAITDLRASARIINDLRASMTADASKIAFVDRRQDVFEQLALLLATSGRGAEALEAAEAGRARAFADLLAQRQVLGKPRDRAALTAVRRAAVELRTSSTAGSDGTRAASDRHPASDALSASVAALDAGSHELASLLTANSPRADDLRETARRLNATIVEYLVTARTLLVWVIEPTGAIHTRAVDVTRERLEQLTTTVRRAIDPANAGDAHGPIREPLRALDRVLVAPIAQWLPQAPDGVVTIVPHGPLLVLPFAALEDAAGRPLIERHVLSFAPAGSVFAYTREKQHRSEGPRRALVIADPKPPVDSGIERLPGAREEGQRVAQRLGRADVRLLEGVDATEAAVKRDAGRYGVLHFATHGLVSPQRPLASSLVLADGGGEDGYLRVDEIFGLDLSADLVVLSGCSTGLGRLSGDGVIGLTRAFLYAGTPSVVVSQWNVSDRATVLLMDRFYAELALGRGPAGALRTATLATRRAFPRASAWAAFELVGEPR